ncbi:hypothetical protein HN836_01090 [Candidatus Woesearchaeota archaeon]|jgi:DNA-binding CsgD family transcriptional regulator|nr:hypothetical protein [archaeon]MBT7296225.1 hypothetical protein [Candidatus Woesearchaeota archaeon]
MRLFKNKKGQWMRAARREQATAGKQYRIKQTCFLLKEGFHSGEIALKLGVSVNTIHGYMRTINKNKEVYEKMYQTEFSKIYGSYFDTLFGDFPEIFFLGLILSPFTYIFSLSLPVYNYWISLLILCLIIAYFKYNSYRSKKNDYIRPKIVIPFDYDKNTKNKTINTSIAGIQYRNLKKSDWSELKIKDYLELIPDLKNKYSQNAIAIYEKKIHLGYIPEEVATDIWNKFNEINKRKFCYITKISTYFKGNNEYPAIKIRINSDFSKSVKGDIKQSTNLTKPRHYKDDLRPLNKDLSKSLKEHKIRNVTK